jgi:ribulose-phosphate 3-epimerase
MTRPLQLAVGVKTDPIQYRYSYEWLFRLLSEEQIRFVQIGTFFELYLLPDDAIIAIREAAERFGLSIASVFTSHRELGGFFHGGPAMESVARRSYERLIEVGALLGAGSVGSNPGSVLRDEMESKPTGIACYVRHMKELLHYAHDRGVAWLAAEPMSCLAEPPTLPGEMRDVMEELLAYRRAHPETTAAPGLCTDVSHGYADADERVVHSRTELLEAAVPYTHEIHLKNTDEIFHSTFGFSDEERRRGVVDVAAVRDLLCARADELPVDRLIGYLEISGPKTGRDYSDRRLEEQLRASLRHVKSAFEVPPAS